jgi:hypothetical protein
VDESEITGNSQRSGKQEQPTFQPDHVTEHYDTFVAVLPNQHWQRMILKCRVPRVNAGGPVQEK